MGVLLKLSALAVRPLIGVAGKLLGVVGAQHMGDAVAKLLLDRFTNHSAKVSEALRRANERAWKTLEFALAEESLLDAVAPAEEKAIREQVRTLLRSAGYGRSTAGEADFRACCLQELRRARQVGLLDGGELDASALAREVGNLAQLATPFKAVEADWQTLGEIADNLPSESYPHLTRLLKLRSPDGFSILTASLRYFFRREVVTDPDLRDESVFAELATIREAQEENFTALEGFLNRHSEQVEKALGKLTDQLTSLAEQVAALGAAMNRLLEGHQLSRRPVTPRDSFSYRDEAEREYIRQLVAQYRTLPPEVRHRRPDLLSGLGKLQMVGGDYEGAEQNFRELSGLVAEPAARAEAFFNAYQAALEKRDWSTALQQLQEACKLDPVTFAPVPLDRYSPERILGAGGFGIAFLCQDSYLKQTVVIKTLLLENSGTSDEAVLSEAQLLNRLEHPAVVKLLDCGFVDQAARSRPYLAMEYFESITLEEQIRKNGLLALPDFLGIARQAAEALKAAHEKGILHRDVKPANILVRQSEAGWQVKLIDFGLALNQGLPPGGSRTSDRTVLGAGIAGTIEYAAPEQMGRLQGVRPGWPADVYSFSKTCCYALFGTTQPLRKHWAEIPPHLVELLESGLSENPNERPQDFGAVLRELTDHRPGQAGDGGRERILEHYQKKLSAGISRSPVLKVSITRSGRVLDVSRLKVLGSQVPAGLLTTVLGGQKKYPLDFGPGYAGQNGEQDDVDSIDRLHDLLDRKMRRYADTAKRETGVHALWLGYPLLYASTGTGETDRWILAPVFLWPVGIDPDHRIENRLCITRAGQPEAARFNRVMALWLRRELQLPLRNPDDEELDDLDLLGWRDCLRSLSEQFAAETRFFDFLNPLEPVPERKSLIQTTGLRLVHAAALGYFRWQNEAILADLEEIQGSGDIRGVVNGFVSTARLAQPAEVASPPEEDRFLVYDSDFSQERVVWQSRSGPGLVVHGPPGTGKSQTIVNVIADTLAREKTVLMVCQKQAATRVVLERLRAVGLQDLCVEVHDAELDRKEVFRAIKSQLDNLGEQPGGYAEASRRILANQIKELENELNHHAEAFHKPHPQYGLSYRELKALEQEQLAAFPTVRALPSLQRLLAGLSWTTVEAITRRARDVGRWFIQGDALHSPWRFGRLTTIQPSVALRTDVRQALLQLRGQDAEHAEHVRQHGVGMALPADLSHFPEVGADLLRRLRPLAAAPSSLILRWLSAVRKVDEEGRQTLLVRVRKAVELSQQVQATPPDPRWDAVARSTPDFRAVAEDVIGRMERLRNERKGSTAGLTECWLRALRGATAAQATAFRDRCRDAARLGTRLAFLPPDPTWVSIQQRVPDFEKVVMPVAEQLERLASEEHATSGLIVQAWLKAVRGASAEKLRKFEADCRQVVQLAQAAAARDGGRSSEQPAVDSPEFISAGNQVLDTLTRLRGATASPGSAMARCWLRALRRADEAEFHKHAAACREAIALTREVASAIVDPAWEQVCGSWPALQLESVRAQAQVVLQYVGRFGRFFSGAFRRGRQQLLRLIPSAAPESLPSLASSLIEYIRIRQERDRLHALNRRLVPDYSIPSDGFTQSAFPRLAEEALEVAISLLRQERWHPRCAPVLDEFLWSDGQAGPAEVSLRGQIDQRNVWQRLEMANQTLIPELHPRLDAKNHIKYPAKALRGLGQAIELARMEQTHPWMAPVMDAFVHGKGAARTAPLVALRGHLARRTLREQLAAANRDIVPGQRPPSEDALQVRYPKDAEAALDAALALTQLTARHTWILPLIEESPATRPQGDLGSLAGLNAHLQSYRLWESLVLANRDLVPGVAPPPNEATQIRFPAIAWESLQEAVRLRELAGAHPWVDPILDAFVAPRDPQHPGRALAELERAHARCPLVRAMLDTLSGLNRYLHGDGLREAYNAVRTGQKVEQWADRVERGLDGLQALINLEFDRRDRSGPAGEVLKALEDYEKERAGGTRVAAPDRSVTHDRHGEWWVALVNISAAVEWLSHYHHEFSVLAQISPEVHASKVLQLKELLARKKELEAQVIRDRWVVRQLPIRHEPWNRMLQERAGKGGQSKSLREAVELSWDKGLPSLRPCWLVSPGAACQIFPLSAGLFDLVIFDEASQCPVEQAIPAIYRGKNLVVSGDDKQLPPTTFFSAGSEIDEEEVDEGDMEADDSPAEVQRRRERRAEEEVLMGCSDLLDAAKGKLKQLYLSVHYRSDHPALINFSNRAFYGGQLEAPPSRKVSIEGDRPIEYHPVNGRYVNRTNPDEAQRVIELLRKLWSLPAASPTVGVVTFNQAQRDLLEDLLETQSRTDEHFGARYREETARKENNQDVGFFVKNLENVQGDERDVMIFSTTFGKDGQGRFYRRFGPVGIQGGHRRLNVAVTRAKKQVIVVGSMPIEEIAKLAGEREAQLTPAGYLQLYLAYAQAVAGGDDKESRKILDRLGHGSGSGSRQAPRETPLEADVTAAVNRLGYQVWRGVGDTGFQLDLAVLHPDPKQGYILGIECDDGASYNGRSARIREVWRPGILERRGWRLHRVWSSQWWLNREDEVRKLQAAISSALTQ
jgi:serine/threonine protein kinase